MKKIGDTFLANHDYQKVLHHYETFLVKYPNNKLIRKELAVLLAKIRQFDKSVEIYSTILADDSSEHRLSSDENLEILLAIAQIEKERGNIDRMTSLAHPHV